VGIFPFPTLFTAPPSSKKKKITNKQTKESKKGIARTLLSSINILLSFFRLDNLILDKKTNKVLAVLDWELATLGNAENENWKSMLEKKDGKKTSRLLFRNP
jgi:hypothetical protein